MNRKQRRAAKALSHSTSHQAEGSIDALFNEALRHHQDGRLAEAEALYRSILSTQPAHAGSLHLLGAIALQQGRAQDAIQLISRAIQLNSGIPTYHTNIGTPLTSTAGPDQTTGITLNRPLSAEREESYSDWLEGTLRQLPTSPQTAFGTALTLSGFHKRITLTCLYQGVCFHHSAEYCIRTSHSIAVRPGPKLISLPTST
jgi:cytochrome c-type biogenesis protein CcmH/NrfG